MSVTISTCEEICHSPVNESKAKMLYTFPKEPRFNTQIKLTYLTYNADLTNFTTCPEMSEEAHHLALEPSMTSQRAQPGHLHQTLTT